jgi:PHP family Zn ribbon phosphoesterase
MHLLPLAEIIQEALGQKNVFTLKVQNTWNQFIERFGSEITVLVDAPIEELKEVNPLVASKVNSFRKGLVIYLPGGGGEYGKPIICENEEEFNQKKEELKRELNCESPASAQRTLGEF